MIVNAALATVTFYLNNNNPDELASVDKGVWRKDPLLCLYPQELHSPPAGRMPHSCVHYIIIYSSKICGYKLSVHG